MIENQIKQQDFQVFRGDTVRLYIDLSECIALGLNIEKIRSAHFIAQGASGKIEKYTEDLQFVHHLACLYLAHFETKDKYAYMYYRLILEDEWGDFVTAAHGDIEFLAYMS